MCLQNLNENIKDSVIYSQEVIQKKYLCIYAQLNNRYLIRLQQFEIAIIFPGFRQGFLIQQKSPIMQEI